MGRGGTHALVASLIVLALFISSIPLQPTSLASAAKPDHSSSQIGTSDVPVWRIGDRWTYAGTFDPSVLIANSGVSASVGEIQGDTTAEVTGLSQQSVDNTTVWAYTLRSSANFDKSGVTLDGYNGNVYIQYTQTEFLRVSDLSSLRSELDMYIRFVPYGISSLQQILGDITITTSYSPVSETYDFPLRLNERWTTTTTTSSQWSGTSDYITPFPPPTTDTNSTTWVVTDAGKPTNSIGQMTDYGGCNTSYELTSYDSQGDSEGYRWYCPEVRNFAWLHTEDDIGLTIDFRLKRYDPVGATGVSPYSNPGSRDDCFIITPERTVTALNSPMQVWVNASSSCFSNPSGITVELLHEQENFATTLTTAANGSAWAIVDSGDGTDPSASDFDYASHGLVAKSNQLVGATTITLDDQLVGLDLFADVKAASILRNRSGTITPLNELTGYNVLPNDQLSIEVSFSNRGITTSTAAIGVLTLPNGLTESVTVPELQTYEVYKAKVNWSVPNDQAIGSLPFVWHVDPQGINSADANTNNNRGEIQLFVGRLPTAIATNVSGQTHQEISINATQSMDEDGGEVTCEFHVPYDDGSRSWATEIFNRPSCILNFTWSDDGLYPITLIVTDEERDTTNITIFADVINRAPNIEIRSSRTQAKVEHPITLYAFANDSDSEDVWPGVVDVYWPGANCKEGYFTRVCTTTSLEEGWRTFMAVGIDDDGTTASAIFEVKFTNIAPHDVSIQLETADGPVTPDVQATWHVEEDEPLILRGQADDSIDDLETLTHTWWPDDHNPSLIRTMNGRTSSFEIMYTTAGLHKVRLTVSDLEGESSGVEERWISVQNVPPSISPLTPILPIAEGEMITVTGLSTDTPSDMQTLIRCWDIDPTMDSDGMGSSDNDCDVEGDNLTISWNRSGTHKVVYHVTDDDGAYSSEVLTVQVLNTPPLIRLQPIQCVAFEPCMLDARSTIDALTDVDGLTVAWDLDINHDSNEDGIPDNDADIIGKYVEYTFTTEGIHSVKVYAWDEDPERPGTKTISFAVAPAQLSPLESIGASLIGEQANPLMQLGALVTMLACIFLLSQRRRKRSSQSMWDELNATLNEDLHETEEQRLRRLRPVSPPPEYLFTQLSTGQGADVTTNGPDSPPPIPASGLPIGWTEEQWAYYGQQWLDAKGDDEGTLPQV